METRIARIAVTVLERADKDHPADAVLRAELRKQRGLSREQGRKVAQAVFTYHRWRGWQDLREPLSSQLERALELARQFAEDPRSVPEPELREHAIPAWIQTVMDTPVEWLRALQSEPTLWLRARVGQAADLAARLGECRRGEPTRMDEALAYEGGLDLFRTPEFQEGEFELQDITSQAVGVLCAPAPGATWWDACAGEGGKTLHLADLMRNKGLIWATDRAAWRLQKLKQRTARSRVFNYRAALWDGSAQLPTKTRFDGVLVDAPCSGVGTWQRNPQGRWTTTPQDIEELGELQRALLGQVSNSLKPGGCLVYSVCTLTAPETHAVADEFARRFPEFQPLAATNPFDPAAAPAARQSWWPQQTGGNGMFVAMWRRS